MTPQMHALIGLAILVASLAAGLWAVVVWWRGRAVSWPLTVGLLAVIGLLIVQILVGMDLFVRGGRPQATLLAEIHVAGPVVALILALGLVAGDTGRTAPRHAAAALIVFAAAAISYATGELG